MNLGYFLNAHHISSVPRDAIGLTSFEAVGFKFWAVALVARAQIILRDTLRPRSVTPKSDLPQPVGVYMSPILGIALMLTNIYF